MRAIYKVAGWPSPGWLPDFLTKKSYEWLGPDQLRTYAYDTMVSEHYQGMRPLRIGRVIVLAPGAPSREQYAKTSPDPSQVLHARCLVRTLVRTRLYLAGRPEPGPEVHFAYGIHKGDAVAWVWSCRHRAPISRLGDARQQAWQWVDSAPFSLAAGFEKEALLRAQLPERLSDLPLFLTDESLPAPVRELAVDLLEGALPLCEAEHYALLRK